MQRWTRYWPRSLRFTGRAAKLPVERPASPGTASGHGHVAILSPTRIDGWVTLADGRPGSVDVYVDGQHRGTVAAQFSFPGAPANSGFHFSFSPALQQGAVVDVRFAGSSQSLNDSPVTLFEKADWLDNARFARVTLATHYVRGEGIEIGALDRPMPFPESVKVRYVDRMSHEDLLASFAELNREAIVRPDFVADGQTLETVPDDSQDFVVASHVIEHMQDPILALKNFLRVLKDGGTIFLAVPDKRDTSDQKRTLTSIDHLLEDHETGAHMSRAAHFLEYAELGEENDPSRIFERAKQLSDMDIAIHFHVWTPTSFMAFLDAIFRRYRLPATVRMMCSSPGEFVVVIAKSALPTTSP